MFDSSTATRDAKFGTRVDGQTSLFKLLNFCRIAEYECEQSKEAQSDAMMIVTVAIIAQTSTIR